MSKFQTKRSLCKTDIKPSASITAFMVRCDGNGPVFKLVACKDFRLTGKQVNIKTREIVRNDSLRVPAGTTLYFVESSELPHWYYVCSDTGCTCPGQRRYGHCYHREELVAQYAAQARSPRIAPAVEPTPVQPAPVEPAPIETPEERDRQIAYWRAVMKRDKARQKAEKARDWAKVEEARKMVGVAWG